MIAVGDKVAVHDVVSMKGTRIGRVLAVETAFLLVEFPDVPGPWGSCARQWFSCGQVEPDDIIEPAGSEA